MSEADIELLRAGYEALSRKDFERAFRDVHPDFELTTPPGINAGTYRGREECQAYSEELVVALETWSVVIATTASPLLCKCPAIGSGCYRVC
jgi:ketosteroid isomerase-like protein